MQKKINTLILLAIVVFFLTGIVWGSAKKQAEEKQTNNPTEITQPNYEQPVLFYGTTCPHCKDLDEWLKAEKIEEKIAIEHKEVYENKQNAAELVLAAKSCSLNSNSVGVPFLYAEGQCLMGVEPIQDYLVNKIVENESLTASPSAAMEEE